MNKKRAIVSVYNKEGIIDFVKRLIEDFDYEIISTGGTRETLKKAGIKTSKIESLTDFPEILDGRVKTLHPKVHGGILADRSNKEHISTIKKHEIKQINLVVVNLYPFKEVAAISDSTIDQLIENIDIGGPTLIRSAAKNHKHVNVVCSPEDYNEVLESMQHNKGETTLELRQKLAVKAFAHTFSYDKTIYQTLTQRFNLIQSPQVIKFELHKLQDLRYGENPHQTAALYAHSDNTENRLPFEVLQGKELSYNNLVDITSAFNILSDFIESPTACIIKHNNPCGVAIGKTSLEAYKKALSSDPISAFGGIVGLNDTVNTELAQLLSSMFLEVIISPEFTEEARSILTAKKNLRLIQYPRNIDLSNNLIFKQVVGGVLIQDADSKKIHLNDLQVVSKKQPSAAELEDLLFAWKVAKHVSSNAIVIAKNAQTLGIGAGQTSRIASMEIALKQACDEAKDAVIASDGFFPAIDNIQAAAQSRISAIIEPGGSIKDKDVIETADKLGISLVFTGIRHFKH